jgi:hypothetical protein
VQRPAVVEGRIPRAHRRLPAPGPPDRLTPLPRAGEVHQ